MSILGLGLGRCYWHRPSPLFFMGLAANPRAPLSTVAVKHTSIVAQNCDLSNTLAFAVQSRAILSRAHKRGECKSILLILRSRKLQKPCKQGRKWPETTGAQDGNREGIAGKRARGKEGSRATWKRARKHAATPRGRSTPRAKGGGGGIALIPLDKSDLFTKFLENFKIWTYLRASRGTVSPEHSSTFPSLRPDLPIAEFSCFCYYGDTRGTIAVY